jgi:hypothetical protein
VSSLRSFPGRRLLPAPQDRLARGRAPEKAHAYIAVAGRERCRNGNERFENLRERILSAHNLHTAVNPRRTSKPAVLIPWQ